MVGVPRTKAGLQAPVLAFLSDDDVFPFEGPELLFGKAGWLARQKSRAFGLGMISCGFIHVSI